MTNLTREQRMLGAAAASVLFLVSLFFPWYGVGDVDLSGDDVIPSFWIILVFAALAALFLAADAYNFELPAAINPAAAAAFLTSFSLIVTLMVLLEGFGGASRKWGIFVAFIFALAAAALALMHWREER